MSITTSQESMNKENELKSFESVAKYLDITFDEKSNNEEELTYRLKIAIIFKIFSNMSNISQGELSIIDKKIRHTFITEIIDALINNVHFSTSTFVDGILYKIKVTEDSKIIIKRGDEKIIDAQMNTSNFNILVHVDKKTYKFRVDNDKMIIDNIEEDANLCPIMYSRKAKTELTPELYNQIINYLETGYSYRSIETMTGISRGRVSEIARGKDKINKSHEQTAKNLSPELITEIKELLNKGIPKTKIEQYTDVSKYYITKIEKGEKVPTNGKIIRSKKNTQNE